ncbi:hypothetical protein J5N97_030186 [Dioscorea zingiberensis]|uniref:Pentatricopeptide repeat-containing protein n=1 Tax=Dioscorea zingiberensis TaxID=325984 RepID=A0A9D5H3W4_9LILI|nr:hypothetical protein J5N97_030186 [Dioscorea zingiberensis]
MPSIQSSLSSSKMASQRSPGPSLDEPFTPFHQTLPPSQPLPLQHPHQHVLSLWPSWHCPQSIRQNASEKRCLLEYRVISGCVRAGSFLKSFELFREMREGGFDPNGFVLASILTACNRWPEVTGRGIEFHAFVLKVGLFNDVYVATSLLHFYGTHGLVCDAQRLFDEMPERNVVSWTALMVSYSKNGYPEETVSAYRKMKWEGVPCNENSFSTVISSCGLLENESIGLQVLAHAVIYGFENDVSVSNAAITLFDCLERVEDAERLFYWMKGRDRISWNSMISLYSHGGMCEESLQCFSDMRYDDVRPDATTLSSLISLCASDALKLFMEMQNEGVELDQFSLSGGLAACTSLASVEEGQQLHSVIIKLGYETDLHVKNAAMDMYGKSGNIDDMLKMLPEPSRRSRQTWNIMISVYARHGDFEKAEKAFKQMLQMGPKPDYVTFVSLLAACNHAGLADKGQDYYAYMTSELGIPPRIEHCVCMVDLLGRSGQLAEAEKFVENMPVKPNDLIWRSLLASSRIHKNLETGKKAAQCLLKLDPSDDSAYVLLSNVCATTGRWEGCGEVENAYEIDQFEEKTRMQLD